MVVFYNKSSWRKQQYSSFSLSLHFRDVVLYHTHDSVNSNVDRTRLIILAKDTYLYLFLRQMLPGHVLKKSAFADLLFYILGSLSNNDGDAEDNVD